MANAITPTADSADEEIKQTEAANDQADTSAAETTEVNTDSPATVDTPEESVTEENAAPEAPAEAEAEAEPEAEAAPIADAITSPEEPAASETTQPSEPSSAAMAAQPPKQSGTDKPNHLGLVRLIAEAVLVLLLIILGANLYSANQENSKLTKEVAVLNSNPQIVAQKQAQDLIRKVGVLVKLPAGEEPTIADVSDVTKAKAQSAFFNNAQNGDKVLLYVKGGTAILFRPATGKVINQGPLNIANTAKQ